MFIGGTLIYMHTPKICQLKQEISMSIEALAVELLSEETGQDCAVK